MENFQLPVSWIIYVYYECIKNPHFTYTGKDLQKIRSFFLSFPYNEGTVSGEAGVSTIKCSSKLAVILNKIFWDKEVPEDELDQLLQTLTNIFEIMIDKVYPKGPNTSEAEYYIKFFGSFVTQFIQNYTKDSNSNHKNKKKLKEYFVKWTKNVGEV